MSDTNKPDYSLLTNLMDGLKPSEFDQNDQLTEPEADLILSLIPTKDMSLDDIKKYRQLVLLALDRVKLKILISLANK